jgi:selenocysteine-specific elongation factor
MKNVNVGVFGNLRSGKSSLVEKLKQRKGMGSETDISFYSYKIGESNVTLIDVPGDPNKIQPMLCAANISDAALLTVSPDRGIDYQTGEIIIALSLLEIKDGAVVLTKSDLGTPDENDELLRKTKNILSATPLKDFAMYDTSVLTGANIPKLMDELSKISTERKEEGSFKLPVDHSIEPRSGFTVVTGTVKRGSLRVREKIKILPWEKEMVVQSIQIHGQDVKEARAGDRIAIGFKGIHYHDVVRGDLICGTDTEAYKTKEFSLDFRVERFYKEKISPGQRLHLSLGLQFYPVIVKSIIVEGKEVDEVKAGDECRLNLQSERMSFAAEKDELAILTRPELPWRMSRICGAGVVG